MTSLQLRVLLAMFMCDTSHMEHCDGHTNGHVHCA